jgi:hypothetical protein
LHFSLEILLLLPAYIATFQGNKHLYEAEMHYPGLV